MKLRGFHWFVAMRYLRGAQYSPPVRKRRGGREPAHRTGLGLLVHRVIHGGSRPLQLLVLMSFVAMVAALVTRYGVLPTPVVNPFRPVDPWIRISELGAVISGALTVIFLTLLVLRTIFSFNSTVSIAGVWIGTMALVFVLSVMSGFESDLRQKILGSNAHIQVSREEGDFVEWEEIRDRVKDVPGVVSSTPFAVSEVVIAANNNYFNVIIKGIDPESIGRVTQLMDDIQCGDEACSPAEAKEVIARLQPLVDDDDARRDVPQIPRDAGAGDRPVIDEMPDDMVEGGDPIDFSQGAGAQPAGAPAPAPDGEDATGDLPPAADPDVEGPIEYGGDAPGVLGLDAATAPVVDPAPADLAVADDPEPVDYSGDDGGDDGPTANPDGSFTITASSDDELIPSPPSRRTKSLPGVLVGRELTKQIHLYTDQEVRMVSPLSDPANPDATGTPIPFNRDYRVAGMFFTGMYEYDLKFVYVTLDSLQDFLDRGNAVDGLEIRIEDPEDTASVVAALQRTLGSEYRVVDWQELNRSLFSALKLEKIAMFLVLAIIILVASFSIVGNLVMVVVEKGKEIALLKTLGADDHGVTWVFITQGFFIGLIGTGLGVIYGLIGCLLAKRFGIPISAEVYYIDRLPIHIDLPSVALIAAAGAVISIAATIYPAMVASRLAPSVGLRH